MALEQQLDPAADDLEAAVRDLALDRVAALARRAGRPGARPRTPVRVRGPRAPGHRDRRRSATTLKIALAQLVQPLAGRRGDRHRPRCRRWPSPPRVELECRPPPPAAGRASRARPAPAAASRPAPWAASSPRTARSWRPDRPPSGARSTQVDEHRAALDVGEELVPEARRPRRRPRSARGCRRGPPGGPRLRSSPAPA